MANRIGTAIDNQSTIRGNQLLLFMSIETTVLDFKLSNTFEEYEAYMNAPEQQAMFKESWSDPNK